MEVRAVLLDTTALNDVDELYRRALIIMDEDSKSQIEKYYHRVDSVREFRISHSQIFADRYGVPGGLIGRLLPRLLLKARGVSIPDMKFAKTRAGKPYIMTSSNPPVGYNITHDNGVVAMVSSTGLDLYPDPPAYRLGIDVMLLQLPKRDTFTGFVGVFSEQLTNLERAVLLPPPPAAPLPEHEQLRRFYLIWTLKEAYTKALGLGMGFDFSRIEYDVPHDAVRIDGVAPRGWEFTRFELRNELKDGRAEEYVGVVARFLGDDIERESRVRVAPVQPEWLLTDGAARFLETAIEELATSNT
ncbi:hypothetical protein C8Q80DRAFT_574355 [Daedaleopsis nitida]|nr:hypothetical protein C8Q80DRAFT_574355 [Daedaleopsis nitida]